MGPDHDLRGFGWLDPLDRRITISNGDLALHDGFHGADRFLFLETKMPTEPAMQNGQNWLLRALARQPGWTVRLLRGRLNRMAVHRVTSAGVDLNGTIVRPEQFRVATNAWLGGQRFEDPRGEGIPAEHKAHTCGWAREGGVWRCVQDFYAKGMSPESGCGATWDGGA